MHTNYNAQEIRDRISPAELLARLGHQPAYRSGKELFYLSMLRDERTPSFCVDENLGVWFDHGGPNPSGIKGGNVIDLALAYWHPLGFRDALKKISDLCALPVEAINNFTRAANRPRKATRIPHYRVSEIKPLGNNPVVTSYLQQRGIWPLAHELISELYYFVEDEKKLRKHFFSAAWQNENGGWEVNNPFFKGCLGAKGLSVIEGDPQRLVVFEGMFDYLSWKFEQNDDTHTAIILNGVTLLEAAIKRASSFAGIITFFDNDEAGRTATNYFKKVLPHAQNGASVYGDFKDYNQKLVHELDALCRDGSITPVQSFVRSR